MKNDPSSPSAVELKARFAWTATQADGGYKFYPPFAAAHGEPERCPRTALASQEGSTNNG